MESKVPPLRIRTLGAADPSGEGEFVLYWMIGQRRLRWNFAVDRAVEWSRELGRPLVILEALRIDYPWASARHHRFVLDGMADHRESLAEGRVRYLPYVEPRRGAGKGLLRALASRACVVVTDDMPHFFYPAMLEAARGAVGVRFEAVDSHGLLPIREPDRDFTVAHSFRRYLHKRLPDFLPEAPDPAPFHGNPLPDAGELDLSQELERWPTAPDGWLTHGADLGELELAHDVPPVPFPGGRNAGLRRMERFFDERLPRYPEDRNEPDDEAGSRLSPYLHWGHVSTHELFHALVEREGWNPGRIEPGATGRREGWWGMSEAAEAFLDELVTWRELGWTAWARGGSELETLEVLPEWAQETLALHADDPREHLYDLDAFDAAETHDELWNAAQRELVREGTIHNYLRMLWGKKILEWTGSPQEALDVMFELNNRYAVDGRDPNSTSGIMWVLGRYDRAWTERPVFGKVRYMTSQSTRRKVSVDDYLRRHAE